MAILLGVGRKANVAGRALFRPSNGSKNGGIEKRRDRNTAGNLAAPGAFNPYSNEKEKTMDKEHVKGAADKAKGAVKDAAGALTGDQKLQAEGKIDKAKGAAHSAVGDVKDALKGKG